MTIRAALAASLVILLAAPAADSQVAPIEGVDVSQWQSTIDWDAVVASGETFAILRATRGADYVDPTFGTNLDGATGAGVVVGTYHRATPSASPEDDAVQEADHFLATARNAAGDLIPALDIEETGGLTPEQLQGWVRTWLERVRGTLGVRPMIYASPAFWRTAMADTTWFADHGYALWIAHWGVETPTVPAAGWSGRGWTFWQWTSTGAVPGITTVVDRDRFVGEDLAMGRISSLSVAAPQGGKVTGPRIDCGAGTTRCVRLANPGDRVTLTATPDPGATVLGWTGVCEGVAGPTCVATVTGDVSASAIFGYPVGVEVTGEGVGTVTSAPEGIGCRPTCDVTLPVGTPLQLTARPDSASVLGAWSGACAGSASTCDLAVDAPISVGARFDALFRLDQEGPGTVYRWGRASHASALGGSYLWERRAGARVSFAVTGDKAAVFGIEGPAMGRSTILVDGEVAARRDWYAPLVRSASVLLDGLGSGEHTVTVKVTGVAAPASKGTRVAVDGLRWGGALRPEPRPVTASWGRVSDPAAFGETMVVSGVPGATATLRFTGTGVTLITARGPDMGYADVRLDGVLVGRIDLFATNPTARVQRSYLGLPDAAHRITVTVVGTHREASTGSVVAIDGWIVR